MAAKHTPGPWSQMHRCDDEGTISRVVGLNDETICTLAEPHNPANAALIETAPELLAALRDLLAAIDEQPAVAASLDMQTPAALAAIAKATDPVA